MTCPEELKVLASFEQILAATRLKDSKAKYKAKWNKRPESDIESNSGTTSGDADVIVLKQVHKVPALKTSSFVEHATFSSKVMDLEQVPQVPALKPVVL